MTTNLEVINHIIEFHHSIRGQIQQLSGSINDVEALFELRGEYAGWAQSSLDKLSERKTRLKQAIDILENGLHLHFEYEEENLPPIFGEVMMKSLMSEHNAIREEIQKVKDIVQNTALEGLKKDEIALHKSNIQVVINDLAEHIEKHASREEIVLEMAREGLEN